MNVWWLRAWGLAVATVALAPAIPGAAGASTNVVEHGERAYEQVTPVDKNGYHGYAAYAQADPTGGGIAFQAPRQASFPGSLSNVLDVYRARRTAAGWATEALAPKWASPSPSLGTVGGTLSDAVSTDLSRMELRTQDVIDPNSHEEGPFANQIYRRNGDGTWTWMTPGDRAVESVFLGGTPDLGVMVISSQASLDPAQPVVPGGSGGGSPLTGYLYAADGDEVRLVSVLPDGTPDTTGARLGDAGIATASTGEARNAISPDGQRFIIKGALVPEPPNFINLMGQLYLREPGRSVLVSKDENGVAADQNVFYRGAVWSQNSQHVTVYFTTGAKLTAAAPASGGLYAYDSGEDNVEYLAPSAFGDGTQNCSQPVPNACSDVVGVADDGGRVYFTSSESLANGAVEGAKNVYVMTRPDNQITLVAVLPVSADAAFDGPPNGRLLLGSYPSAHQQAQLSRGDGRYLVFQTTADLTGFDPDGSACTQGRCSQIYRYDAATRDLQCVSCGTKPVVANSWLGNPVDGGDLRTGLGSRPPQYISDDGRYVFFNSAQGIDPADTNGATDAYQWHGGRTSLLSRGQGEAGSYFLGASADGTDVFINTSDRLVKADQDNLVDVYDVRIGGGFPDAPDRQSCSGDSCQGPVTESTEPVHPGSVTLVGPGNAKAASAVRFTVRPLTARGRVALARGATTLRVSVNRPGRMTVRGTTRIGRRTVTVFAAAKLMRKPGAAALTLRLTRTGRRALASRGRLRVAMVVRFSGTRATRKLVVPLAAPRSVHRSSTSRRIATSVGEH